MRGKGTDAYPRLEELLHISHTALVKNAVRMARLLRKKETWAEKLMWSWLRERRFSDYKFRRQHTFAHYLLDFFCLEAMLNIELDGGQHGFPNQRQSDAVRDAYLEARGIKTPRNFAIEPTGKYMLVANQSGNDVISFAINQETGELTPTGSRVEVGAPVCVRFMPIAK